MCSQSRIVSGTKAEGFSLSITTVLAEILFYSLFVATREIIGGLFDSFAASYVATFLLSHRESTQRKISPRWASASLG